MKEIDASHVTVRMDIERLGLSAETVDGIMQTIYDRKTDALGEDMYYPFSAGAFWIPIDDTHPFRDAVYESARQPDLSKGVLYIEESVMALLGFRPPSAPANGSVPVPSSAVITLLHDEVYRLAALVTRTVNGFEANYTPVASL